VNALGRAFVLLLLLLVAADLSAAGVRLVDAVKNGDKAAIRALVQQRVDVNAAEPDGTTALHWAARINDLQSAEMLIRAGANVKAMNRFNVAPIYLACINGNSAMIEMLLKAGADPNTALPEGETALMTASRTGNVNAVKVLLAHGADVNAKESWRGQTALMWAAAEGHSAVIRTLLDNGADISTRSSGGLTAFLFSVREGRMDAVKTFLAAGSSINESLPARGARGGGANPVSSAGPPTTANAFLLAVENVHYELAAFLLDAGADANASPQGWTALHLVTWLRKPGVGDNNPAPQGSGKMSSLEFVKTLVAHGANVNARATKKAGLGTSKFNAIGATPFLLAARTADVELMRLLLQLGADPKLANVDDTTPLLAAAGVGTGSPGEDPGSEAEVLEAVKLTLELGGDINAVDKNGETVMHGAAHKHLAGVVRLLAERGAKVEIWNQPNKAGLTPLKIADGIQIGMNIVGNAATAAAIRDVIASPSTAANR